MRITHLKKPYELVAVTDKGRFTEESVARANHDEETTPPYPLVEIRPDVLRLTSEEGKKKPKKSLLLRLNPQSRSIRRSKNADLIRTNSINTKSIDVIGDQESCKTQTLEYGIH